LTTVIKLDVLGGASVTPDIRPLLGALTSLDVRGAIREGFSSHVVPHFLSGALEVLS
jgi:hypothetical protein